MIGKRAICSVKRTYAALGPRTMRRGARVKGASCPPTPLTVCFSLAALAEGAVVGRRGAAAEGTFAAQPLNVLAFTEAHIFIHRILTEQQQPLRVYRHISVKSGFFFLLFFLPQQSQKSLLFSVLVVSIPPSPTALLLLLAFILIGFLTRLCRDRDT